MCIKNIFIICSLIINYTPIYSMHIVAQSSKIAPRVKNGYNPRIQKRHFGGEDLSALIEVFAPMVITPIIGITIIGYTSYKICTVMNKELSDLKSPQSKAYAYLRQCSEGKHAVIINDSLLEQYDRYEKGRFNLLLQLKERYEYLNLVENLEKEKWLNCDKENIVELKKIEDVFEIIEQQRLSIFTAVCVIESDIPNYQKKREAFYTQQHGIARMTPTLKACIAQRIEQQPMLELIQDIKDSHEKKRKE